MTDAVARRLAALALACSLVALVLAGWGAFRAEAELRDLRRAVQGAMGAQTEVPRRPPPTFDVED